MCGRFSLATHPDQLARQFELADVPDLAPHYNVAPTQDVAVVRSSSGAAPRELVLMRWGLVPYWAKSLSIGSRMINARCETVATLPAFRDAFARRRCLIPADGFFEWIAAGGVKQPYWIHPSDGGVWGFAGVWERWRPPEGPPVLSCAIVTTPANGYIAALHDRMPAVIGPADYEKWLDVRHHDPAELAPLLTPLPDAALEAVPVSTRVNKPDHDDASLLTPTGPPLMRL
jgi:putative SOS response-associated peptidase YedK